MKELIIPFLFSLVIAGCNSTARLYKSDDTKRITPGQLDESTYNQLRQFLATKSTTALEDTIIIKYDYNNETCWNSLDQQDDHYINGVVTAHEAWIQNKKAARPHVSIFHFREPGDNINKIIKKKNYIEVDSTRQLLNLAFKDRSTCGSSMMLLPGKKFIYYRSDSHSEIMDLTREQIEQHLARK